MIRFYSALAPAPLLLLPAEGRAQERSSWSSAIAVGSRIRLSPPTLVEGRIEGIVIEMDEEGLLLGINDRVPLRVARQAITQMDVSTGQHSQALKGALVGAGIGVAVSRCHWRQWRTAPRGILPPREVVVLPDVETA